MFDYPLNFSDSLCELELDLMVQYAAERESMEYFYAVREYLQYCLRHIQLLEAIVTNNSILIPEDED